MSDLERERQENLLSVLIDEILCDTADAVSIIENNLYEWLPHVDNVYDLGCHFVDDKYPDICPIVSKNIDYNEVGKEFLKDNNVFFTGIGAIIIF